jgi:hypothetical protein
LIFTQAIVHIDLRITISEIVEPLWLNTNINGTSWAEGHQELVKSKAELFPFSKRLIEGLIEGRTRENNINQYSEQITEILFPRANWLSRIKQAAIPKPKLCQRER